MRLAVKAMLVALPFGNVYSWNLTQVPRARDSVTPTTNINNTSPNFAFRVENCGELGAGVLALLAAALHNLPPVINDLQFGINSRHGYQAWFKSNVSSGYVLRMLQNIYTAQPKWGLQPEPDLLTAPRFVCVAPSTIYLYPWMQRDPYYLCTRPFSHMGAYYLGGSSYILLCPRFWSGYSPAPTSENCPRVIHNRFVGDRALLSDYSTYILIHEMVHFYLGADSLTLQTFPSEKYELNECVALNLQYSLFNPSNYQNYIAMVQQSCTRYPDPNRSPFPSVEGNSTAETTALNNSLPLASSNPSPMPSNGSFVGDLAQATSLAAPLTRITCAPGLEQPLACGIPPIGDS